MKITISSNQDAKITEIRELQSIAEEIPGVINLARDHSDFETPEFIREAVKKALDEGVASHIPTRGFLELREKLASKLKAENNIDADPVTDILMVTDTTPVVFSACRHLIEAGDEVIMVDPGFDYGTDIQLFSGIPVRVPAYESNGFVVDPEDIRSSVTDRTKMIIINTPANPTGAVLDKTVLKEIANIAREHDLWILSDETYEQIVFDGNKHTSIGSLDGMKDRTISVYSFSTSYAMIGWEVVYVVAPQAVIDEMEKLDEHMGFQVAAVVQRVALAVMNVRRDFVRKMVKEYEKSRAIVHRGLNAIEGVSCLLPVSTFYAFPNFTKLGLTSWNLAKYLMREHKVALVPGSIFGTKGEGFLRLSFASHPATLKEAISYIEKGVGQLLSR
jgi:aspartate/methionine/tyrosine aminotransferase